MNSIVAAPAFITKEFSEVLEEGDSRKISVKFTGLPVPECEWRLNNSLIRGVQINSSSTTSSMHIKQADVRKHSGVYTIILKNKAGVASTQVDVTVIGTTYLHPLHPLQYYYTIGTRFLY